MSSSDSDDFHDPDFSDQVESDFNFEVDSIPLAKLRPHLVPLPRRTVAVGPGGKISKKYLRPTAEDVAAGWDPLIFGMQDMMVEGAVGATELFLTAGCDLAEGSVTSEGRCHLRVSPKNPDGSWDLDGFVLGGSALTLSIVRLYRMVPFRSAVTFSFVPLMKRAYRTREESELVASFCFYAPAAPSIQGKYFVHYGGGRVYLVSTSTPYSPTELIDEVAGIAPTKDRTKAVVSVDRNGRDLGSLRAMPRELYLKVVDLGDELRYLVTREDLRTVKIWCERLDGIVRHQSPTYYPEDVMPRVRAEATRRTLLKYDAYCELMYPPSEDTIKAYREILAAIRAKP